MTFKDKLLPKDSRLFFIGDLHGDGLESSYLSTKKFKEQKELTKKDIVFQLGDFGFYYSYPNIIKGTIVHSKASKKEYNFRKVLSERNFTLFVILGNHENYDLIEKLPTNIMYGAEVYYEEFKNDNPEIESTFIYIAKRGEIYTINGKTIFTMGGALSQDKDYRHSISDIGKKVIVNKERYGEIIGRKKKTIKLSDVGYWERELPTEQEENYAMDNLAKNGYEVDYIFTHTCPSQIMGKFIHETRESIGRFKDPMAVFLDEVYEKTTFKEWKFGHLHTNSLYTDKFGSTFECHISKIPTEILY